LTATVHATPPLSLAALVATKKRPKAQRREGRQGGAGGDPAAAPAVRVVLEGDQRAAAHGQGEADRDQGRRALSRGDTEGDRDDGGQRCDRRHHAHRADGEAAVQGGEAEHLAQAGARGDGHRRRRRRGLPRQREEHEQEQQAGPL
jgi:hypothetical protein